VYPYVAFSWTSHRPIEDGSAIQLIREFRRIRPDWKSLDGGLGLSLFHLPPPGRSAGVIDLPIGCGAIFGTLFPNDLRISPQNWRPQFDERMAEEIVRTRGRYLVDNYWGGYVAFTNDHGNRHCVLRDCSGKIPCYAITCGGITVVTSNTEYIAGLGLTTLSINPNYLAGFIYATELSQQQCGLNEIQEVLAGQCLELREGKGTQFTMWDPRSISRDCAIEDFEEARRQVGQVTQACIDFWGSKYDRIVHRLSGGLDSSVILGCLKRSPYCPALVCLHLESGGPDDNERMFAQMAAAEAGVELVLQPGYSANTKYDDRVFELSKAPNPSVANLGMTLDPDAQNQVPARMKAESVWDGEGGDHLFFSPRSPFGAIDYAFRHGVGRNFLACVRDAVRRSRLSYWGVLEQSIRLGLFRGGWHPEDQYDRRLMFLNPELASSDISRYVWQPWSEDSSDLPPGKRWQICLLSCLIHRHRPVPELQYVAEHHPLFSQPLFELCLRIPLYTLLKGGGNRALERAAFRDCVPEAIIRRENKGSVATALMGKIRESLPYLRGLMLDGVLVREKMIDDGALIPYLIGNRPMNSKVLWPFLSCIAAEVWARKWAGAGWRI
jgi:asparagine synthase (glutamine-hydrolysing)